jgi:hypothetical protein
MKKTIFGRSILISILSAFVIGTSASAATTISTDISTGGTLTVTGLSSLGQASTTQFSVSGNSYFPGGSTWLSSGNLGIGTTSPYAPLSVVGAGGVVAEKFIATSTTATSTFAGNIVVGTRPNAFALSNSLAMNSTTFSDAAVVKSTGASIALGSTNASGPGTHSIEASGASIAFGTMTHTTFSGTPTVTIKANGGGALAGGYIEGINTGTALQEIAAFGLGSFAMGILSTTAYSRIAATGFASFAQGYVGAGSAMSILSSGRGSFAQGYVTTGTTTASGNGSFAVGDNITASGVLSTAFGTGFTNSTANSFMVGYASTPMFTVTSTAVGIGTTTPTTQLQVTTASSNATSTLTVGKVGQNKGSCLELFDSAGTAVYAYVAAGATTFTLSSVSCK